MNDYMTFRDQLNKELAKRGLKAWTEKQPGEFILAALAVIEAAVKQELKETEHAQSNT